MRFWIISLFLLIASFAVIAAPPTITSSAITSAIVGQPYSYDVEASGVNLSFLLQTNPSGMSINNGSGLIQWTPSSTQLGSHPVSVLVRESSNLSSNVFQNFTILVTQSQSGLVASGIKFGSATQQKSNPRHETAANRDVFTETQFTITNTANDSFTNLAFKSTTLDPRLVNFTINSISQTTLPPGQSATIQLRARVPETLDTVDTRFKPAAQSLGTASFSANNASGTTVTLVLDVQMQAENKLRFSDIDVVVGGRDKQNLDVEADGDRVESVKPGDTVVMDIEVENFYSTDDNVRMEDIEVQTEIDDNDFDVDEKEDLGDLSEDEKDTVIVDFFVDEDVDDGNYKIVYLLEGRDEFGAKHGARLESLVEVERDAHDLEIRSFVLTPSTLKGCFAQTQKLTADIRFANIGKRDEENTALLLTSNELALNARKSTGFVGEDDVVLHQIVVDVPANLQPAEYRVDATTFFDQTHKSDIFTATVKVNPCGGEQSNTEEESSTARDRVAELEREQAEQMRALQESMRAQQEQLLARMREAQAEQPKENLTGMRAFAKAGGPVFLIIVVVLAGIGLCSVIVLSMMKKEKK